MSNYVYSGAKWTCPQGGCGVVRNCSRSIKINGSAILTNEDLPVSDGTGVCAIKQGAPCVPVCFPLTWGNVSGSVSVVNYLPNALCEGSFIACSLGGIITISSQNSSVSEAFVSKSVDVEDNSEISKGSEKSAENSEIKPLVNDTKTEKANDRVNDSLETKNEKLTVVSTEETKPATAESNRLNRWCSGKCPAEFKDNCEFCKASETSVTDPERVNNSEILKRNLMSVSSYERIVEKINGINIRLKDGYIVDWVIPQHHHLVSGNECLYRRKKEDNTIKQIELCNNYIKYSNAISLLKDEKFDVVKDIFVNLGDFKDSKEQMKICENNIKYNNALELLNSKNYGEASELFKELAEFKDSKNKLDECNCNINLSKIKESKVGDIVTFGSYEQDLAKAGKEPIEWIVLERNASESLLLSKYGLECLNYHDSDENTNWAECWIRNWLNCEFYHNAFNLYESHNLNRRNNWYNHYYRDYSTRDKVFLLNEKEFEKFYTKSAQKDKLKPVIKCEPTEMVKSQINVNSSYSDFNYWRLMANGINVGNNENKVVDKDGKVIAGFLKAFYSGSVKRKGLIRPAICVKFGEK